MSNSQAIESWLKKSTRGWAAGNVLGAVGLFLLAGFVLFVTFWVVYAVVYLGFNWLIPHSHTVRLWISLGVVVLLLIGNLAADRAELETYSFTTGTRNEKSVVFYIPYVGMGSTINPLAPDTVHSYAKMITNVLYTGPRLLTSAIRMLGRARRLAALDVPGCAAVLGFLATKDSRAPFAEVAQAVPRGHDVVVVLQQMHEIDGVMFLQSDPAGLTLLSDFRDELRQIRHQGSGIKRQESEEVADS